jgi:primosomal protein N' (replication factor Y)
MPEYVAVALPLPLFQTFTYALDDTLAHPVVPGSRVIVPFRGRRAVGVCVEVGVPAPTRGAIRTVLAAPDPAPVLDAPMLALCRWIADYYVVPPGIVIRSAIPAALTGERARTGARGPHRTQRVVGVVRDLPSLLHRDALFARAPRQRALFELLEGLGGRAAAGHLLEQLGCSPSVLQGLVDRELVEIRDEIVDRDPFATRATPAARHAPTPSQTAAIATLSAAVPGEVVLLHGVTGSGKTLVYVEFLRRVVDELGRSAIVLVPEIALTPQTVDRFRAAFGDRVAVLHSALGEGERHDAWAALRDGRKRIAVGARSAVFAPLADLGAIIVDEEHEASYKQGETPRYHAREVAVVRAREAGAVTVLGSATPSLESWVNAAAGKYRLVSLPDRVGGGRLPAIEVVDLRRPAPGASASSASAEPPDAFAAVVRPPLEGALRAAIARGEQAILLLNRRGYAAFVQCTACGDVAVCPNCSISLTSHRAPERLVCHYCRHAEPQRATCARCGGVTLRRRGLGTQQVERLLGERFPEARIARMDVDTTSGKWAHAEILDRVGRGEVDILLGTQMIAKGLDFANVTVVGVIDADVGLNLPDFRASERCFQLLSQVAGRAGRGPKGGRVFIQTRLPDHHAVRHAVAHAYEAFVDEELAGRVAPPYPPVVRLANIVFSAADEARTAAAALDGAAWLTRLLAARGPADVRVIGPAPCPVERIKGRWRWHLLLRAEHPASLSRVGRYFMRRGVTAVAAAAPADLRVTLDRDPVALL